MSRIENSRVMGNILGLMYKILDEKKTLDPVLLEALPPKRVKFYCQISKIHVQLCQMRTCKRYGFCSPETQPQNA